jgi:type IV secretory pathway TraG/TraD family ATPase VirD4
LIVLDEAANIAPVPDLDVIASTGAGQGIQLVTVFQDLVQGTAVYGGRAKTIFTTTGQRSSRGASPIPRHSPT